MPGEIVLAPWTCLVKKLSNYIGPDNPLTPAFPGDAGVDLYAAEKKVLYPGDRALIATGIAIALPDGFEAQVRPRSGNALKLGLMISNAPGTIDSGYRDQVSVICYNSNPPVPRGLIHSVLEAMDAVEPEAIEDAVVAYDSKVTITIEPGMKIGQLVFARFERPEVSIVSDLPPSDRGLNGFGSTGITSKT